MCAALSVRQIMHVGISLRKCVCVCGTVYAVAWICVLLTMSVKQHVYNSSRVFAHVRVSHITPRSLLPERDLHISAPLSLPHFLDVSPTLPPSLTNGGSCSF